MAHGFSKLELLVEVALTTVMNTDEKRNEGRFRMTKSKEHEKREMRNDKRPSNETAGTAKETESLQSWNG